jgi:peptidoglycan hydrolase CwlO-like protein
MAKVGLWKIAESIIILSTVIGTSLAVYDKIDKTSDTLDKLQSDQSYMKKDIENISDSLYIFSQELKQTKQQVYVTREVISVDPTIKAQLEYLTRIIEQQNEYVKKKSTP